MRSIAAARSKPAEDEWISRLRRGDAIAIAELVACYEPRIRQQAMRYVPRHEDAEEIAQDVLVKVWRKLHLFRGDAALSSWVHRITFNTAMSRLRNTRMPRTREVASDAQPGKLPNGAPSTAHDMPDWTGMADESVLRSEMRAKLAEAIAVMPVILPDAGGAPRSGGPVDCGGQRASQLEQADAEVPRAPRAPVPAAASGGVRQRPQPPPQGARRSISARGRRFARGARSLRSLGARFARGQGRTLRP
jgi:RNA polymerase sigma factor (sigma-70 family)